MSNAPKTIDAASAGTINRERPLSVSLYDQMAALMVAGLFVLGVIVTLLFVVWLTNRVWTKKEPIPIYYEEGSGLDAPLGTGEDFEEPGDEEVEDLTEPQLQDTLVAITDAISSQQSVLDAMTGEARSSSKGSGLGHRDGGGTGGNGNTVPRYKRWKIQYDVEDLKKYGQQLDFFKVEIAVIRQNNVDYCFNFKKSIPDKRTAAPDNERLYFFWKTGPSQAADRDLLKKADVRSGKLMVQYYTPETENLLAHVENQALDGRPLPSIKQTMFGVKPAGNGFEFFVIDMKTRARY